MTRRRLARGALTGLHLLTLAILVGSFAQAVHLIGTRHPMWGVAAFYCLAFPFALGWWAEIWRDLRSSEQPLP